MLVWEWTDGASNVVVVAAMSRLAVEAGERLCVEAPDDERMGICITRGGSGRRLGGDEGGDAVE